VDAVGDVGLEGGGVVGLQGDPVRVVVDEHNRLTSSLMHPGLPGISRRHTRLTRRPAWRGHWLDENPRA
jgi:hypothetical protein